jgi:MoxR-like ATPase
VLNASDIQHYRSLVSQVHIEEKVLHFIAELIQETRTSKSLFLGASPRASVAVLKAAKAIAAMAGRDFVTPDDVIKVLYPVLCHRIILTPEKEMEGSTPKQVIEELMKKVEVPR